MAKAKKPRKHQAPNKQRGVQKKKQRKQHKDQNKPKPSTITTHSKTAAGSRPSCNVDVADPVLWLSDKAGVKSWLAQFDVRKMLDAEKGLVCIHDFLPESVAARVLERVGAMHASDYERALSSKEDTVQHSFSLAEPAGSGDPVLEGVAKLLWWMLPDTTPNFSVGRYGPDDHISPHDDKVLETYTKSEYQAMMAPYLGVQPSQVPLLPGHAQSRQVVFSREVACVYYLNKNWTEANGGLFIDLEADKPYLPTFNTLVMFRVPRMHGVTPVIGNKKGNIRNRFSIFGWWLLEGKLYKEEDEYSSDDEAIDARSKGSSRSGKQGNPRRH